MTEYTPEKVAELIAEAENQTTNREIRRQD